MKKLINVTFFLLTLFAFHACQQSSTEDQKAGATGTHDRIL